MGSKFDKLLFPQPLWQPSGTCVSGPPAKVASGQEHTLQGIPVCPKNIRYSLCAERLDMLRSTTLEDFSIAFLPCLILSLSTLASKTSS